jgi:hypothetical protein
MISDLIKEQEYYSKPLLHSYSSLTRLLYSPQLYYKYYILKEREEVIQPSLVEGKVVHCLLLDNGTFNDQFVISPGKLPEGNNKLVCEQVFKVMRDSGQLGGALGEYKQEILAMLKEIDLHQSLVDDKKPDKDDVQKTGDSKRLEKMLSDQNISYFQYLTTKGTRIVISQETFEKCSESVSVLRDHAEIAAMLGLESFSKDNSLIVFNEIELRQETHLIYPFGLKGVLDNYAIDHARKIIRINDLKTTGKSLHEFRESLDYFRYDIQAVIQKALVIHNYMDLIQAGYQIIFTFVVIDKYQQVYPFEVSASTMMEWENKFEEVLKAASWHYEEKRYDLPYEFSKKVTL